jgi:ADP-ribose pyrophosphatase YjhB (NUDIX family)
MPNHTTLDLEFRQYPMALPERKLSKWEKPRTTRLTMASGGMIFAHNKILLDRADTVDMWSIPGGVVRFDESPEQTVVRELREELNLDVEIADPTPYIFHFTLESEEFTDYIILLHFLIKVKGEGNIRMGGDVVDYRWESIGSHFKDCYPNVKPAVDHFMKI